MCAGVSLFVHVGKCFIFPFGSQIRVMATIAKQIVLHRFTRRSKRNLESLKSHYLIGLMVFLGRCCPCGMFMVTFRDGQSQNVSMKEDEFIPSGCQSPAHYFDFTELFWVSYLTGLSSWFPGGALGISSFFEPIRHQIRRVSRGREVWSEGRGWWRAASGLRLSSGKKGERHRKKTFVVWPLFGG